MKGGRLDMNEDDRSYDDGRDYPYATHGSGHALASLIIGIIAVLSLIGGPILSFAAVILGIIGLILASGARRRGYAGSMATIGKVLSIISIIIGIIFIILFILLIKGIIFFGGYWFTQAIHNATTQATLPHTI